MTAPFPHLAAYRARFPHRDVPAACAPRPRRDHNARAGRLLGYGAGPLARLAAWAPGPLLYVVAPLPLATADLDAMSPLDRAEVVAAYDAHLTRDLPGDLAMRWWVAERTAGRAGHHLNLVLPLGALAVWGDHCPGCGSPLGLHAPDDRRQTWHLRCSHCNFYAAPTADDGPGLFGLARYLTKPRDDRAMMGQERREEAAERYLRDLATLEGTGRRYVQTSGFRNLPRGLPGDRIWPAVPTVEVREGWTLTVASWAFLLALLTYCWATAGEELERDAVNLPRPALPRPSRWAPPARRDPVRAPLAHRRARAGPGKRQAPRQCRGGCLPFSGDEMSLGVLPAQGKTTTVTPFSGHAGTDPPYPPATWETEAS